MNPQDLPEAIAREPAERPNPCAQFESWLRLWMPLTVELSVTFTRNRSTLLSFRRSTDRIDLRLHHMFAEAGPHIAQAICLYVQGHKNQQRGHKDALKSYLASLSKSALSAQPGPVPLRPRGDVHLLQPLFDRLNHEQFSGRCTAAITWGRASTHTGRRRSVTLGSYNSALNLIRIHPCLDQAFVPEYVVQGVVHHEMLHEIMGTEERAGRRRIHPPEFVALERMYPDYGRCVAWEQRHIGRLLAYRP